MATDTTLQLFEVVSASLEPAGDEGITTTSGRPDGCAAARAALHDSQVRRKRWGNLLLLLGIAILITVAALIIQLLNLDTDTVKVTAAATALAGIVQGGAVAFLVKRQREAQQELLMWVNLVHSRCDPRS